MNAVHRRSRRCSYPCNEGVDSRCAMANRLISLPLALHFSRHTMIDDHVFRRPVILNSLARNAQMLGFDASSKPRTGALSQVFMLLLVWARPY